MKKEMENYEMETQVLNVFFTFIPNLHHFCIKVSFVDRRPPENMAIMI